MNQQLQTILQNQSITPVYQPIVSLKDGSILSYETLSRITDSNCSLNIEQLFRVATEDKRLWELEKLCRKKSLQQFGQFQSDSKLFINVDGNIIHDPDLKSGYTLHLLQEYDIEPSNIIFEITEQNAVNVQTSDIFVKTLDHYRSQNFSIAIDDYGCGYSGLNRVCVFNPDYLKIDMQLIRDIDSDSMKKSAVSSTIQFCKDNGISVIAEGIETEAELNTLIQLGAEYGQGYFLGRPEPDLTPISPILVSKIKTYNENMNNVSVLGKIHALGTRQKTVYEDTPALSVYKTIKGTPSIEELFVLNHKNQVTGILTRQHVLESFGGLYGFNLSQKQSAAEIMEKYYLAVDAQCSIESVAETAMKRDIQHIYDAIAITKKGRYISTVTVKDLLLSTIQIQTKKASDANPLTGLPGNSRIQEKIRQIFAMDAPWSLVYFDLDNFKAYNDAYGFGNGDLMIEALANILKARITNDNFCGHVGGDDFILISQRYVMESECEQICKEFTLAIQSLYSSTDWEQGYIVSQNRAGETECFPIASLSIAIVTNQNKQPASLDDLFHLVANTKKLCKCKTGHSIVII